MRTHSLKRRNYAGVHRHPGMRSQVGIRIPVELFQILKDDAVKVLHSICQQIWKTQQWPQDWKRSVFILKDNAKECSNYRIIVLISYASKAMLKILQARLQQYMNHELPDVQAGFSSWKRQINQRSNCHHPCDHLNSRRVTEKHLLLLYWLCQSLWMSGSQQTEKSLKRWEYQTIWPDPLEKSVCRSRSNS